MTGDGDAMGMVYDIAFNTLNIILRNGCRILFLWWSGLALEFVLVFLPGTICLVQPVIVHDICHILVLRTFTWVSRGFSRRSFRVSSKVLFRFRVSLEVHLKFLIRISDQDFKTYMWVSLGVVMGFS